MKATKLNFTLKPHVAELLKAQAKERGVPASQYVAALVEEDAQRRQDALAAEGYRLLSRDTGGFADAAVGIAHETWPEWNGEKE